MDDKIINREIRLQAALERLRTLEPKCVLCGHKKPHALQLDHIFGKAFNKEETEILCLNCHADRSDLQKDHPRKIEDPPHILEVIARLLSTLGDHLIMMADIALKARIGKMRGGKKGFSLKLFDSRFRPPIQVVHQSSRNDSIQFALQRAPGKGMRRRALRPASRRGCFVDVKNMGAALLGGRVGDLQALGVGASGKAARKNAAHALLLKLRNHPEG